MTSARLTAAKASAGPRGLLISSPVTFPHSYAKFRASILLRLGNALEKLELTGPAFFLSLSGSENSPPWIEGVQCGASQASLCGGGAFLP